MTRADTIKRLMTVHSFSRQQIEAAANHLDGIILEDKLPGFEKEEARYEVLDVACKQAALVGGGWGPIHSIGFINAVRKASEGAVEK